MRSVKKSEADKARPCLLDALSGAESIALPYLEAIDAEASYALRVARDAVSGEVWPAPSADEVQRELAAFDAARTAHDYGFQPGMVAWILHQAIEAAVHFAADRFPEARKTASDARRYIEQRRRKAEEQARDQADTALREAYLALRRGETPQVFTEGEGDAKHTVELLAAARACGGVVIVDDSSPILATEWIGNVRRCPNFALRSLASQVERAMSEATRAADARRHAT